jgi:ABC-type nickel/cobalt efflux system permease component RcnA
MSEELALLSTTAAFIGFIHTLIGPDHYLPFIAMASARKWSLRRTLGITAACGFGHVAGSVALGLIGIGFGWTVSKLTWFEGVRGGVAGWLLLGFGLAYLAWGLRQAVRNRPHKHLHVHADNMIHEHAHQHADDHAHVHDESAGQRSVQEFTPWILFIIFIFGPCEALIPVLMYPAAEGRWWWVGIVVLVFAVVTVGTMLVMVAFGYLGLAKRSFRPLERHTHALAGLALVICGLGIQFGL